MGSFKPQLSKLRGQPRITLSRLRGQHFLTDKNIVAKIIAAAELTSADAVLEVGPGLGVMTREILPRVARLVAVELDPLFVRELKKEFGNDPHLDLVDGDILKMNIMDVIPERRRESNALAWSDGRSIWIGPPTPLGGDNYKVITNLPYNITSAFLKKFLVEKPLPERIVVMLQKEVAARITTNDERLTTNPSNLLGLMCNLYADCSFVCRVSAGCFAPPPKVDSAVIRLEPYSDAAFVAKWGIERSFAEDIVAFAARFFASPRKKMAGLLAKPLAEKCKNALISIGESPDSRPAALSLEIWVELWKKMR